MNSRSRERQRPLTEDPRDLRLASFSHLSCCSSSLSLTSGSLTPTASHAFTTSHSSPFTLLFIKFLYTFFLLALDRCSLMAFAYNLLPPVQVSRLAISRYWLPVVRVSSGFLDISDVGGLFTDIGSAPRESLFTSLAPPRVAQSLIL